MESNNIVELFPGKPSAVELHVDDDSEFVIEFITSQIIELVESAGYTIEDHPKDFCLIVEALHSFISRYYDRPHPFHTVAEHIIEINDTDPMQYSTPEMEPNDDA